jgi:hypothetical protein
MVQNPVKMKIDYDKVEKMIPKNAAAFSELLINVKDWMDAGMDLTKENLLEKAKNETLLGHISNDDFNYIQENPGRVLEMVQKIGKKIANIGYEYKGYRIEKIKSDQPVKWDEETNEVLEYEVYWVAMTGSEVHFEADSETEITNLIDKKVDGKIEGGKKIAQEVPKFISEQDRPIWEAVVSKYPDIGYGGWVPIYKTYIQRLKDSGEYPLNTDEKPFSIEDPVMLSGSKKGDKAIPNQVYTLKKDMVVYPSEVGGEKEVLKKGTKVRYLGTYGRYFAGVGELEEDTFYRVRPKVLREALSWKRIADKLSQAVVSEFELNILNSAIDKLASVIVKSDDEDSFFFFDMIKKWVVSVQTKLQKAEEATPEQMDYDHHDMEYYTLKK